MTQDTLEFDEYAQDYEAALDRGISMSGETKDYFAQSRIAWLADRLEELNAQPCRIMDYGCGIGSTAPFLRELFPAAHLLGVDVSRRSLEVAKRLNGRSGTSFLTSDEYHPNAEIDLTFCNGVFHHIPPRQRSRALDYIHRSLRSGGLFAFWENNPWNPCTRYVMSRIPFDRGAITVSALQARRLLKDAGFEILRTDFLFIFPKALRWFRPVEPFVAQLPLAAQYQVLCLKP